MSVLESRRTVLPEGHPYLLDARPTADLCYLSWGSRRFGVEPIPPTYHEGWVYILIKSGTPRLQFPARRFRHLRAGQLVVIAPDCATGMADRGRRGCEIVSWVWRSPPSLPPIARVSTFAAFRLSSDAVGRVDELHRHCRSEISRPDACTQRRLELLRGLLDIEVVRSRGRRGDAAEPRLEFALAWLDRHGDEAHAVRRLADYLQLSPSALNRFFKKQTGMTVADWIHARKMKHAERLIEEGALSRKAIGFQLGYRHAGDFSRAWSRWLRHRKGAAEKTPIESDRRSVPSGRNSPRR